MKRREFLASGLAAPLLTSPLLASDGRGDGSGDAAKPVDVRTLFPRLEQDVYLNAASQMPLSRFGQDAVQRYVSYQQLGPHSPHRDYVWKTWDSIRGMFAQIVGAKAAEIGLVECTKAGEQIAIDAVDHIKPGGNIVTNDLHFSGGLHNLYGMKKAGRDVRIVRARDWTIPLEAMEKAIDSQTALVDITLVSNINGHIEDVKALAEMAHRHGALLYADIIQAAGAMPLDLPALGVDIAACSGYKWLYGVFGAGFLFVSESVQGDRLGERLFPGRLHPNYAPWVKEPDPEQGEFIYKPNRDASRYEPGHVNYMGYCAAYEGLKFLLDFGLDKVQNHSVQLNQRLLAKLDPKRYPCISPHTDRATMISFLLNDPDDIRARLKTAKIAVTISGNRMRVSPAVFNSEADIDALVGVLNS